MQKHDAGRRDAVKLVEMPHVLCETARGSFRRLECSPMHTEKRTMWLQKSYFLTLSIVLAKLLALS
jgi:hypothetical protein